MSLQFAIPSYKRPATLAAQTLTTLQQEQVPKELITIFVANSEEETLYRQHCPDYKIVVGELGLTNQRNFITRYYPEGTHLVSCDDDIKKFKKLTPRPFLEVAEKMFELCNFELCTLWGLYPVNNLFFCKERVIKSLSFIIGNCYGYIVNHDRVIPVLKNDKWFSLWHYVKDGAVLRYEGICADTKMYAPGGLTDERKIENESISTNFIVTQFPNLCESRKKRNGRVDVYFRGKIMKKLSLF